MAATGVTHEKIYINFLRAKGFRKFTNGVMRIFTDQLNSHIAKEASRHNIEIHWWPSISDGSHNSKLEYIDTMYAKKSKRSGNFIYCILADKKATFTYSTRQLLTKEGNPMIRCIRAENL